MAHVPPPLQGIPADIELHRQMMFSLEQPVHFSPAVYEMYFPYVDNIWCFHEPKGKVAYDTGIENLRGACRLHRKPHETKSTARARKRREGTGTCRAKFRMAVMPDGSRVLEKYGDTSHSHDLDYIDSIKRNSAVRKIVLHEYFRTWDAGAILAYLRDPIQKVGDRDMLKEAGGQYINRSEISNIVTGALKKAHPGQDPFEIKRQQDKYKAYCTCGIKGCTAPPFSDARELKEHKREVHGLQKHDHTGKLPCPDKTCSRRKQSRGFMSTIALQDHLRRQHGVDSDATQIPVAQDAVTVLLQSDRASNVGSSGADAGVPNEVGNATASEDPISVPARRHMEDRLRQMEKDWMRLGTEIATLRQKLYCRSVSPSADMQMSEDTNGDND